MIDTPFSFTESMLLGHLVEGLYQGIPPAAAVPVLRGGVDGGGRVESGYGVGGGGGGGSGGSGSSDDNTTQAFATASNSSRSLASGQSAVMAESLRPSSWLGPYPRGSGCSPSGLRTLDVSFAVDASEFGLLWLFSHSHE